MRGTPQKAYPYSLAGSVSSFVSSFLANYKEILGIVGIATKL
jgi:hypothetical protein